MRNRDQREGVLPSIGGYQTLEWRGRRLIVNVRNYEELHVMVFSLKPRHGEHYERVEKRHENNCRAFIRGCRDLRPLKGRQYISNQAKIVFN